MTASDQDHQDIPPVATGARFTTGNTASGVAALVGDAHVVDGHLQLVQDCHDPMKMLRNQARKG